MKIKAKKDFKWCINYKTSDFKKGETYDIQNNEICSKILKNGYADPLAAPGRPKKIDIVPDNKAIESAPETKKKKKK